MERTIKLLAVLQLLLILLVAGTYISDHWPISEAEPKCVEGVFMTQVGPNDFVSVPGMKICAPEWNLIVGDSELQNPFEAPSAVPYGSAIGDIWR